jgi:hypothetical protein
MKFTVREGFVLNHIDRLKMGDKTVDREFTKFPEDDAFELDKLRATEHAHKLEPADKEAVKFLESLHVATAPEVAGAAPLDVAAIVAAAVQAGMAAAFAASKAPA